MQKHRKQLLLALALIFALNILIITLAQSAQAATYRQGSSGEAVRTIQQKLVRWGYFDGPVDGIYGSKTAAAVKRYAKKSPHTNATENVFRDKIPSLERAEDGK